MSFQNTAEQQTYVSFWENLPRDERLIVDILRQIVLETLPQSCKERFAYNVPCYYGKRRICLIWPASIKGGGIKNGVLLGFWQGYKLKNTNRYIYNGTNKRVYYRVIQSIEDIDEKEIVLLLKEALEIDPK